MVATRDIKCGNDVAKMAALGRYAEEFIIYAVSYQEKGRLLHRVGSGQEEIWRFIEECQRQGTYPTIVEEWVNRTLVPSGERENDLLRSKIRMAQKMKQQYTEAFFSGLGQFAQTENNNAGSALLWQCQDELIGCFDREQLERFRTLVQYAYNGKKLSSVEYERLQRWLAHIFKQMEDDVIIKKNFKRTFYGFGYLVNGEQKYWTNAQKSLVWQQKQKLMIEGKKTTPIWQKTYWYDFQPNLMKIKQEFLAHLQEWFDDTYWQRLSAIDQLPSPVASDEYNHWMAALDKERQAQIATAMYYKNSWGI